MKIKIDNSPTRRQPDARLVFFALFAAALAFITVLSLRVHGEDALNQAHTQLFSCDSDTECEGQS